MNAKKFLSSAERQIVEDAVRAAESKTSGEIRVLVIGRARPTYRQAIKAAFTRGATVKQVLNTIREYEDLMTDKEAVEKRACDEFMTLGIQQTKGRTGVLVMIAIRERMVNVKADESINERVLPGTWGDTTGIVIEGIKNGKKAEGIADAVRHVGEHLAVHFPRRADDTNELPDEVVFK